MRLRKLGHSCVLVEADGIRVLVDPGSFSAGFEGLDRLDAVLFTHQHVDHYDVDRVLPLLERNADARVVADAGTAPLLREHGADVVEVQDGDTVELAGLEVQVFGRDHAVIHPDIPVIPNVGYLFGGRFFHPGDQWTVPDADVEVLGLPTAAPWVKGSEAVDYLRRVAPRTAVPIHDGILSVRQLYYGLFERLAPAGTRVRPIDDGDTLEL